MRKTKLMKKTNMTKTKTSTTSAGEDDEENESGKDDDEGEKGRRRPATTTTNKKRRRRRRREDGGPFPRDCDLVAAVEKVLTYEEACTGNEPLGKPGDPATAEESNAGTLAATPPPRQVNN